jgi:hypothetical protein
MEAEYVRRRKPAHLTANTSYSRADLGTRFDNAGATGTVVVQLPTDAVDGDLFYARVSAAQNLTIKAGASGVFTLAGAALTAGHGVSSSTAGDSCTLECTGANAWRVVDKVGSWADQA